MLISNSEAVRHWKRVYRGIPTFDRRGLHFVVGHREYHTGSLTP
jgi:hypothetical protein